MGIFRRKPNIEKLLAKEDIEGLIRALENEDVRESASDAIRTLVKGSLGHYWVQLLLHWGLFHSNGQVRKAIAKCFTSNNSLVLAYLENIESRGWAALREEGLSIVPDDMRTRTIPSVPDEQKLANRVAQFKNWMTGSKPPPARKARSTKNKCALCGIRLNLGNNIPRLQKGFDVVDAVHHAATVLAVPGYTCKYCGAVICSGCMPSRGIITCPKCGAKDGEN